MTNLTSFAAKTLASCKSPHDRFFTVMVSKHTNMTAWFDIRNSGPNPSYSPLFPRIWQNLERRGLAILELRPDDRMTWGYSQYVTLTPGGEKAIDEWLSENPRHGFGLKIKECECGNNLFAAIDHVKSCYSCCFQENCMIGDLENCTEFVFDGPNLICPNCWKEQK